MHNYNPANKYSMKTRMGNWSEEWDLEETKYELTDSGAKSTSDRKTMEFPKSVTERKLSCRVSKVYILLY